MAKGAGKKRGKAKAAMDDVAAPPQTERTALELPGAPPSLTGAGVSALQLPGAPRPPTQPEVDTTRRLHGGVAPSQATALQLADAPPQPPHAEVALRPLAIVPAPAHVPVPPQADVAWFRRLLEALGDRFTGTTAARILEALQGAWASVHGWWSGPPLAVAAPELKKKNKKKDKKKDKKKNKKPVIPVPRRSKAWLYWEKRRPPPAPAPAPAPDEPQPSQPAPVPVIVDGETVPAEILEGYKRYCRIARSSPATTTVCHLCIFEVELHPNGIVRTTDMIAHCNKHPTVAVRCGRFGCAAKVPPGRDLREHTYFFHDQPDDWWRLP